MQSKNLLILARELNISVIRLRSILLYMLNDLNVAADKLSTRDIYDVIKSIDRKNYYYTVPEDLCSILFEQKAESKSLIPIDQVVEENKIVPYTMREFINEQKVSGGYGRLSNNDIFRKNIFSDPKKVYVVKRRVNVFLNYFFIYLSEKSKRQIASLPSDGELTTFKLLDDVQNKTSTRGRIIGFARNADKKLTPIVAFLNGKISFLSEIFSWPKKKVEFPKSKTNNGKQMNFSISLEDCLNKNTYGYLNIFLAVVEKHNVDFEVVRTGKTISFMVTTNAFVINLNDFLTSNLTSKSAKRERAYQFGNIGKAGEGVEKTKYLEFVPQEMVGFLKSHCLEKATVFLTSGDNPQIKCYTDYVMLPLMFPKEMRDAVVRLANTNGISTSRMFMTAFQASQIFLNETDLNIAMGKMYQMMSALDTVLTQENKSNKTSKPKTMVDLIEDILHSKKSTQQANLESE